MNQPATQQTIDEFVGAAHGDLLTVKKLLAEFPAIWNSPASWGEYAIQAASQTGQVEIAELLLGAGASIDICTAAMLGNVERVEAFLNADPNLAHATGAHQLPVLYHAAVRGNIAVAETLLAHGADVNAGGGKNTALHGAVFFRQIEMVGWLLAHGASVNARDFQSKTPLAIANQQGHSEIATLLQQHGGIE
jgi:ankyrin repeat protein